MTYKRVNISGRTYLKFVVRTHESATHATSNGGWIVGEYNTGWVCYVPMRKGVGHAPV